MTALKFIAFNKRLCSWGYCTLGCDTMQSGRWMPSFWTLIPWTWRQQVPPQPWYLPSRLHSVTSWKL